MYVHSLIRSFRDERLKVAYRDYRIGAKSRIGCVLISG